MAVNIAVLKPIPVAYSANPCAARDCGVLYLVPELFAKYHTERTACIPEPSGHRHQDEGAYNNQPSNPHHIPIKVYANTYPVK